MESAAIPVVNDAEPDVPATITQREWTELLTRVRQLHEFASQVAVAMEKVGEHPMLKAFLRKQEKSSKKVTGDNS